MTFEKNIHPKTPGTPANNSGPTRFGQVTENGAFSNFRLIDTWENLLTDIVYAWVSVYNICLKN